MKDDDILNAVLNQLGDSYEYIKPLGEGASSKVYLVYNRHLKQKRALKIMDHEFLLQLLAKGKGNIHQAKEESAILILKAHTLFFLLLPR